MNNNKVINLYAGPGTGKSTTCAALFAELKYRGHNTEMILEYIKDAAWEGRGPKIFQAQDYIFAKQHFRLSRVVSEVKFCVTDAPLLFGIVYNGPGYLPSLPLVLREAYDRYDNLDIFLVRNKPYNPKGRNQTEDEAKGLDVKIKQMLLDQKVDFHTLEFGRENVEQIIELMNKKGWL